MSPRRVTYLTILAGSTAWCAAVILAPVFAVGPLPGAGRMLYEFFRPICHQLDDHSFHIGGAAFGVCARCFGIYAGFLAGALIYPLVRDLRSPLMPSRRVLALALAPMLFDVGCGMLGVYDNTNLTRVITGGIFGLAAPCFILPGALDAVSQFLASPTPLSTPTIAKG